MKSKILRWFPFIGLIFPGLSMAQDVDYEKRVFLASNGHELPYRILFPAGYGQTDTAFPLLLFLHGAGERGDDNQAQLVHGGAFLREQNKHHPAIVVFPQCAASSYWIELESEGSGKTRQLGFPFNEKGTPPMEAVQELLDSLLNTERVGKVYLGGLSMGAFGGFDLLARRPDTFEAAFLICGGGNTLLAPLYAPHTRLWLFHGTEDSVVPVQYSQKMYEALQEAGANVRYTEYPEVNHDSWNAAFAEPELLNWLFAKP
ncbi:MAG TPA: prolyl oligopeptidase family serine peptidase [Saprospiraceae bacterium]|nr:prolyl oligopeptidase family serine peptidase [Saprospiraceae bacterium]HMQ83493.1 prolyl oligopeptidase family serine peptidase [Saprospiraceae bacterium]